VAWLIHQVFFSLSKTAEILYVNKPAETLDVNKAAETLHVNKTAAVTMEISAVPTPKKARQV
jgi:hypothetical protein